MKKLLSICLAVLLSFSLIVPSYAKDISSPNSLITVTENGFEFNSLAIGELSDTELKAIILELGLSNEQADELIALKNATPQSGNARASIFPSNPSIGDTFMQVVYVSIEDTYTVLDVYSSLVSSGVPAAYATLAAAAVFAFTSDFSNPGSAGIEVTIEYYYGYDNDGEIRWNYRRVWCEFYALPLSLN